MGQFRNPYRLNEPIETTRYKSPNNRNRTFITSCLKELKKTGKTYCYAEWQIAAIEKHMEVEVIDKDEFFLVKMKGTKENENHSSKN